MIIFLVLEMRKAVFAKQYLCIALGTMAIGCGLASTRSPSISLSSYIAYQLLFGPISGVGALQAVLATSKLTQQKLLPWERSFAALAVRTNLAFFAEMVGGSMAISIASTVFLSHLSEQENGPSYLSNRGIPTFRTTTGEDLDLALKIYDQAFKRILYVSIGFSAFPFAVGMLAAPIVFLWRWKFKTPNEQVVERTERLSAEFESSYDRNSIPLVQIIGDPEIRETTHGDEWHRS